MGLEYEFDQHQIPLEEEEREALKIPGINTRGELNEFEQQNIEQAIMWTLSRNFKADYLLSEAFVKLLHKTNVQRCMVMGRFIQKY